MKRGNVLITGGNGFVCMNIAEYFLERGVNVVTVARHKMQEEAEKELSSKKGEFMQVLGDVLDREFLFSLMNDYDIADVINGAAVTPSKESEMENPRQVMDINCIGLMNTLDAARENRIRRFIYLGSVSGYGETCFTSDVLVEGVSQGNPRSLYELSKFTGERSVQRYRELFDMDAYVARIGDVFGNWERRTGVRSYMSLIYQTTAIARKGGKAVLPKPNRIDWVHGKEIAAEVCALMYTDVLQYDTVMYTDLDTLLANSDVISLHCPLFPSTQGIINRETIAKMKDGVMIINNSRGGLIIEEELRDALNSGKVAGAAIDVASTEPVRMDNPLLEAENIILTPHIAWAPKESRQRLMDAAVDNLRAFLDGRAQNIVNSI